MSGTIFDQTLNTTHFPVYNTMELSARNIDKCLINDNSAPSLIDLMNINAQSGSTASGLIDNDYPNLNGMPLTISNLTQIKTHNKVPLPPEIMEHFSHFQYHCMMGLFPEIHRAWLSIDSDIYVWTYEEGADVAYYDGLNDTILSVGLVRPKIGVFHSFVKYLLILTTSIDIVVLGITFTPGQNSPIEEIQLVPEPIFTIPTDGMTISTIIGTNDGRLFLGSKEGSIFEIAYQAQSGWFGKRCKKINHSTSTLSFLLPSFLTATFSEDESILQFSVDNSRHILYVLTVKGTIITYDMGEKGNCFSKISVLHQSRLVTQAMNTVKTLDSQNFRPIISISAVEARESLQVNLVAVSQTGVRFYLSGYRTLMPQLPKDRPGELQLLHVRLPPGYSANVTIRPRCVHMADYSDRNLLLISTVNEKDTLWCLSSDLFPFSNSLMEVYNVINLDGPVLAMCEIKNTNNQFSDVIPAPPLVVRQHYEPPKKYVVLTAQGAHIFLKLRPVDVLRQLLIENHGQDSEIVKSFFIIQKEDQACATSLILASLESAQNSDLAAWATRAFFMFGGEPRLPIASNLNQTVPFSSSRFSPNVMSTPMSNQLQPQQLQFSPNTTMIHQQTSPAFEINMPFLYSAKHNGLYLYLSRILRPIWNMRCVEQIVSEGGKKTFLTNTLTSDECMWLVSHLKALHSFVLINTQLSTFTNTQQTLQQTMYGRGNYTLQDAQLEERQSLDALKLFISHVAQVMGLWKILCEHQFHTLVSGLSENYQHMLQNTTFKDLFLYGHELCSILIVNLINSYLGDNASVDNISAKLRDVCPTLYKNEDAAYSKANEILKTAKATENVDEREELLMSALQLCKSVTPNINLNDICKQFTALQYYQAVMDLCITCAKKFDPDNLAEEYYKKNTPASADQDGEHLYLKRMDIYKEVLNMLETLYTETPTNLSFNTTETLPVQFDVQNVTQQIDGGTLMYQILSDILHYQDELLHVAVYDWMVTKHLQNNLIKVHQPSLERYLLRETERNTDNMQIMNLLWKYYESNNNHSAAAKILNNLASKTGDVLTLKDRLGYLARAVMCMRNDNVGYAPFLGIFLKELEDKIEVAKVQEQILIAICNIRDRHPNAEEAITALNSGLYEITQLYEDFADPFQLWECKLAIIECAGYTETNLIELIWSNILQSEVNRSTGTANNKMIQILSKVKVLGCMYKTSMHTFPLAFIISELEIISSKLQADCSLVPNTFLAMNIAIDKLIAIYTQLVVSSLTNRYWCAEENEFHYSEAVIALISAFINTHENYSNADKRKIVSLCEDCLATLLSNLYSKSNADHITNNLRTIKTKLSRI